LGCGRERRLEVRFAVVLLHHLHSPAFQIYWGAFGCLNKRVMVLRAEISSASSVVRRVLKYSQIALLA